MEGIKLQRPIWIDLDNSPHVPFFAPIIKELRTRGYNVVLSARDAYQVYELANRMNFQFAKIGRHYGKHKFFKVVGTCLRAVQLAPFVLRESPILAVSHGSRGQMMICSLFRIPAIGIMDYEFARNIGVFSSKYLMIPDVIPDSALISHGQTILRYPGIKEDVYAPQFTPDPSIYHALRLKTQDLIVTLRPPANEAHYHNPESDALCNEVVTYLCDQPGVTVVLLPRNARQADSERRRWSQYTADRKLIVPENAVDGLNLIWHSDLVISGGGTMNREAAALGVPVYSIFRGPTGSVDRHLSKEGRLILIESVEEVRAKLVLRKRERPNAPDHTANRALNVIVEHIIGLAEECSEVGTYSAAADR